MTDRKLLEALFSAAVKAADPFIGIQSHLPQPPAGRTVVIGAGKAASQMALALESLWQGPLSGVVVTRYGYGRRTRSINVLEASHPVPDAAGLAASAQILEAISDLSQDDLVIALISGGGSALLPLPPQGLTLDDEILLNEILLASGAPIAAMNTVRKHLSTIKGGRLAAATKARVVSLVVSDVPGDNLASVASGPTIPDETNRQDALAVIEQYKLKLPLGMMRVLNSAHADAPEPDDPVFARNENFTIASASRSLEAAARAALEYGVTPYILSDSIEGESRDVALVHAGLAREVILRDRPFTKPTVLLSGGETTVTVRSPGGRGGRNSEFALALALALDGLPFTALAADTDGVDGSESNAGAFVDGTSAQRLRASGLVGQRLLDRNDSFTALASVGDLFMTGPTGTNVNDFRAILLR